MILYIFRLLCEIASKQARNNTALDLVLKIISYEMNLEWVIMSLSNLMKKTKWKINQTKNPNKQTNHQKTNNNNKKTPQQQKRPTNQPNPNTNS